MNPLLATALTAVALAFAVGWVGAKLWTTLAIAVLRVALWPLAPVLRWWARMAPYASFTRKRWLVTFGPFGLFWGPPLCVDRSHLVWAWRSLSVRRAFTAAERAAADAAGRGA